LLSFIPILIPVSVYNNLQSAEASFYRALIFDVFACVHSTPNFADLTSRV